MKLNQTTAKKFAFEKFKEMPELELQWNYFHSIGIIEVIDELGLTENKEKLISLAWIHDIGKIEGEKNHAETGLKILAKYFELDEIDKDCIKNHGSSGKPLTKEGKFFRFCDGLSIFNPKVMLFRFYAEGKEGKKYEEIKKDIKEAYEKYLSVYSDDPEIINLLKKKYSFYFD